LPFYGVIKQLADLVYKLCYCGCFIPGMVGILYFLPFTGGYAMTADFFTSLV
jgi:hypothetical protein